MKTYQVSVGGNQGPLGTFTFGSTGLFTIKPNEHESWNRGYNTDIEIKIYSEYGILIKTATIHRNIDISYSISGLLE
eukprot:gene2748-4156_t